MTPELLNRQLERHLERLAAPADVAGAKQAALEAFNEAGLPTRRHESFKYTDLRALAEGEFDLTSPAPDAGAERAAAERIAEAGVGSARWRCVFVDGHYSPALSSALPDGLELEPGSPARARKHPEAASPLATLNAAFSHAGGTLRVAGGARIAEPVELVFVGSERPRLAPQLTLAIELGTQAELTLVQHFIDTGEAEAWLNAVIDVDQRAGSRLTLYRIQQHAASRYQTSLLDARLGRDAHLTAGSVEVGGRLVRNELYVALDAPGASVDLFGVALASGDRVLDNDVRVDHRAPHTTSAQTFRAIADDAARAVFSGKVVVRQHAQHIDAQQSSDNLLLSKRAEIDARPQLEIYADDVKCSHGATVGELDEQQLFYLRARGIDAAAARGLLTFAFLNSVLEKIGIESLREIAAERVAGVLPDKDRWEQLA